MPRNARGVVAGLAYHVTQRWTNHQRVFFFAADRGTYLKLLQQNAEPAETRVLAWCMMTNPWPIWSGIRRRPGHGWWRKPSSMNGRFWYEC